MKKICVLMLMLSVAFTYAQKERNLTFNEDTKLIEVTYFHDNGEVSQTGFYTQDGKLHGDWFRYCQEGNKIASAKYNSGKKVGKWFFWENDKLREVDFSNNSISKLSEWKKSEVASN